MPRFVFAVVAALVASLMQWSTGPAHAQGDPVMCNGLVATIVGTDGDDVIEGTWQDDVIVGGAGNDTIRGASGADTICGGDGDDDIDGDSGADVLRGGQGNDTLRGQSQDDDINGDDGDDDINGDSGDDTLDGGNGFDVVDGSWGVDTCDDAETAPNCETLTNNGEDGSVDEPGDPILCDGLVATIVGTDGDDVIQGTWQDDVIVAGDGNDTINAGPGADTICAGPGDDVVNGESQNDRIFGEAGDDTLDGADGADVIDGGAGNDTILGQSQADVIHGGNGDDDINGGPGPDTLDGGNGTDVGDGSWQDDTCDDFETTISCEVETSNGEPEQLLKIPTDPQPLTFPVNTDAFDGVSLEITTSGGLYPWDFEIDEAATTAAMNDVVVSEIVDINVNPDAPGFERAELTLTYDEVLVNDVAESALRIWTYDEASQLWLPAGTDQVVDVDANTVTASLEHFSIYTILEMDLAQPELWGRVFGKTPVQCVADDAGLGVDVVFGDVSGSMRTSDPLDLRVASTRAFLAQMRDTDRAGIVAFNSVGFKHQPITVLDSSGRARVDARLGVFQNDTGGTSFVAALETTLDVFDDAPIAGRPKIAILLSDGVGGYDATLADQAAAADITIYTIGLGTGASSSVLGDIATRTGGQFLPISSASELVPLYEQLSSTVFDDGTDTDLDTITDCVETNGAFTPAAQTIAGPGYEPIITGYTDTFITTNEQSADTDADGLDDNVELVEADLRSDPLVADTYAYLIDEGITRYYMLISDPNDPLSIGSFETDIDRFSDGLMRVDGLNVSQETLFQPIRYGGAPVIDSRLTPQRTDGGYRVATLAYDSTIVYDEDEDCVVSCTAVEALAQDRKDDGRFGCSFLGDDLECEIREIIDEARSDQGIFTRDDYISSGFLRDQIALRCALAGNNVDRCVSGAALLFFFDIEPDEIDLITRTFLANDAEFLIPGELYLIEEFNNTATIGPGDTARFLTARTAVTNAFLNYALLDSDGDEFVTLDELGNFSDPVNDPTGDLAEAAQFLASDARVLDEYGAGTGYSRGRLAIATVRSHGFTQTPDSARSVLESFPLVTDGTVMFQFDDFEGGIGASGFKPNAEPALILLFDRAIATVPASDRVTQNDLISRLPETRTGIRNNLITALYIEYSQFLQGWLVDGLDPADAGRKGNNWGLYAPWASQAVRAPIVEDTLWQKIVPGPVIPVLRQAAGDGNQWIFKDVGSRFAALVQLLEANPDPTPEQWEDFFDNNFADGEQQLRDGFLAFAAAKYEPELDRAQRLLFQSNLLLATHEQSGVQPFLEDFAIDLFDPLPGPARPETESTSSRHGSRSSRWVPTETLNSPSISTTNSVSRRPALLPT